MENFYDPAALPRFEDAVKETIPGLPHEGDQKALDPAIAKVLASLGASHTGHYTADELDYYELLNVFQFNYRRELPRLFPPEGRIVYPGIGIASKVIDGKRFVTAVYDGGPAKSAGVEQGDEIISADGAPFEEIGSFRGRVGKSIDLALRRGADAAPITIPVPVAELHPADTLVSAISNQREIQHNDKMQTSGDRSPSPPPRDRGRSGCRAEIRQSDLRPRGRPGDGEFL